MDESDKVECRRCGQLNRPDADFCWECFTPMKAPVGGPSAGSGPAAAPAPAPQAQPAPASEARPVVRGELPVADDVPFVVPPRRVTLLRVLLVVLGLALAVFCGIRARDTWRASFTRVPASIVGYQQMDVPTTNGALASLESGLARLGAPEHRVTFYGTSNGPPTFALIWLKSATNGQALVQAFASSQASSVNRSTGTSYYCTPQQPPSPVPVVSACAWEKSSYWWVTVSSSGQISALEAARGASVGQGMTVFWFMLGWIVGGLFGLFLAFHYLRRMFFS